MVASRLISELVALVAPPACATCRAPLLAGDEALCPACRRALPWLEGPRCRRCGLPAPCRPCLAATASFEAAWAPLAYAGTAALAVTALKFRGTLSLADVMAAHIAANAPPALVHGSTIVPVPLHPRRLRGRGYNQAERLARATARRLSLPVASCLERRGASTRQVGAGRARRVAVARLDFVAVAPAPARAVLIDDVHTTGATLEACARALRGSGARTVRCVTYARTLPGS